MVSHTFLRGGVVLKESGLLTSVILKYLFQPCLQDFIIKYIFNTRLRPAHKRFNNKRQKKNISIFLFFMCHSRNCESQISSVTQNKMCFLISRKQTFICFVLLGVYFGKSVTTAFGIGHQKSLRKLLMEHQRRKATDHQVESTALYVHVSVLLALSSLCSMFSMIQCVAYSMRRMT